MINFVRSVDVIRHARQGLSIYRVRSIAVSLTITCALIVQARAEYADALRYRGGLRNSPGERKLNAKQLDAVLASLRGKTGLLEMWFDESGFLALGDQTKFSGGSATARALLYEATSISHAVDLESHMHSSQVAFARLAKPIAYHNYSSGAKIDVFPLEIDFSDLSKLRGDQPALAAFDLGFVILHELGHTVFGLRDATDDPRGLGECEALINRIRRELNLPERLTYVAQIHTVPMFNSGRGSIKHAELIFTRAVEKQGRMRIEKFNLTWEASAVGPVTETLVRGPGNEERLKIARERSGGDPSPQPE